MKKKTGIIQSRGLGDILIALPIARHYWRLGHEIHWPICAEFVSSVERSVPWVKWYSVQTDVQGLFFFDEPLRILQEVGVELPDILYLYQYLSSQPELTNPELFNILKFDQYKYWVAKVPFVQKWTLADCIVRDPVREAEFQASLNLPEHYLVRHQTGSDVQANIDCSWLEKLAIVDVDDHKTDCIFDWLSVLEDADAFVGLDSAFANLVDQMCIDIPNRYWVRRSSWDLTPVLGGAWQLVSNPTGLTDPVRVNPATEAERKRQHLAAESARRQAETDNRTWSSGGLSSTVPFTSEQKYPTNFMFAVKQP